MAVHKVEAHAPPREVMDGRRGLADDLGNHVADAAAGAAAEAVLDLSDAARRADVWERRTFQIARRLAAIIELTPTRT